MNTLSMVGNLGKDPQMNDAGTAASVSVAVQRSFKNRQTGEYETDWFNCKAFGKTAEIIANNFRKGSKIAFVGHLQNNNYEKNGQMIYRDEVIINSITFIEPKRQGNSGQGNGQGNYSQNSQSGLNGNSGGYGNAYQNNSDPIDIQDEDLPFDFGLMR